MKCKVSPFVYKIIKRIEQFKTKNEGNSWKSTDAIVSYLLTLHEYSRSKIHPLRKATEEAIGILKQDLDVCFSDLPSNDSDLISEQFSEDGILSEINLMQVKDTNSLNRLLTQSYVKNNNQQPNQISETLSQNHEAELAIKRKQDSSSISAKKPTKKQKSDVNKEYVAVKSSIRYSDFGGIESCLADIRELIERPFLYSEMYVHLGVDIPRGILLFGPPGCGKTCLAEAISNELNAPLLKISAPEVVSGMSGESEAKIRELFDQAKKMAPCIVFIDEIDAITPKRETAQREMERRIVAQLLTCMDDISLEKTENKPVLVIGATNRPDSLDPALRRAGRFDREIKMGIPDETARMKILQVFTQKLKLEGSFDFLSIARKTPGYVGADLRCLAREAANIAINRIFDVEICVNKQLFMDTAGIEKDKNAFTKENLDNLFITEADFEAAIPKVQPSAKREGFAVVPNISWDDVGALSYVREELRMAVIEPLKHPEKFAAVGITSPAGLLLWGPPGCGKTLLAKAVANESHSNFISIKGPELLNKYVGESERAVRQVFERARASAPCIIFFDELDALCPKRNDDSNIHSARVVNQLLTELDGLEGRKNVFIIAATNRPDIIDPAMIRPGRLDKLVYVELPNPTERLEILKTLCRKTPLASSIDLAAIACSTKCNGFSGADLSALVREAALATLKSSLIDHEIPIESLKVKEEHFDIAFTKVFPSISHSDRLAYEQLRREFTSARLNVSSRKS